MIRIVGILLAGTLALAPATLRAQESDVDEGFSLIGEGAKLLLRGLTDQVQPMMEGFAAEVEPQLRAFADDLAPMMESLSGLMGDINAYHPPERLPNGDIILRRKTPLEMEQPGTEGEVDL